MKNATIENPRVTPFAIANNENNKAFISAHQIPIIFENNNFIIINTEMNLMTVAENSGKGWSLSRPIYSRGNV